MTAKTAVRSRRLPNGGDRGRSSYLTHPPRYFLTSSRPCGPSYRGLPDALQGLPPPELALVRLVEELEVLDGRVGVADLDLSLNVLGVASRYAFVDHRVDLVPHPKKHDEVQERYAWKGGGQKRGESKARSYTRVSAEGR